MFTLPDSGKGKQWEGGRVRESETSASPLPRLGFCTKNIGYSSGWGRQRKDDLNRSSVQFSRSVKSASLRPHEPQHARPPCPSPTARVCSNSCPLSQWYHPTISSSVIPSSSRLQSYPASRSFLMSQFAKLWNLAHSISHYLQHLFKYSAPLCLLLQGNIL